MRQSEFRKRFAVDGLLYEFSAVEGGSVTFRIIGGGTPSKPFTGGTWETWDDDIKPYCDQGYHRHGGPVLTRVAGLVNEWVRSKRPFGFHFRATNDRKHRIFRRMVERRLPSLPQYAHHLDGREFWFVRKAEVFQ